MSRTWDSRVSPGMAPWECVLGSVQSLRNVLFPTETWLTRRHRFFRVQSQLLPALLFHMWSWSVSILLFLFGANGRRRRELALGVRSGNGVNGCTLVSRHIHVTDDVEGSPFVLYFIGAYHSHLGILMSYATC